MAAERTITLLDGSVIFVDENVEIMLLDGSVLSVSDLVVAGGASLTNYYYTKLMAG
ncbi:MAG: hypothetical protein ACUZ8H_14785 [Candidatus Anammoxibacter sp.]